MIKNINSNNMLHGVAWFFLSLLIDNINDVIMKYLGFNIQAYEVVFFRFLFSTLTLIPFIFYKKVAGSKPKMYVHLIRGLLLFSGIVTWCMGLGFVNITVATAINFTIPIYILVMATVFLKEKYSLIKLAATVLGFIGTAIVINPSDADFNFFSLVLIASAFLFAALDVINKKMVQEESTLNMLFYSGFFVMLFSAIPTIYVWSSPTIKDLALLFILGITGNLILYCLLKSFKLVEISSVAPYRYIELIFSAAFGYIIFGEVPHITTIVGAIIIIFSTLLLIYETFLPKLAVNKIIIFFNKD